MSSPTARAAARSNGSIAIRQLRLCTAVLVGCSLSVWYLLDTIPWPLARHSQATEAKDLSDLCGGDVKNSRNVGGGGASSGPVEATKFDLGYWQRLGREDAEAHGVTVSQQCDDRLGDGFMRQFQAASGMLCGDEQDDASSVSCHVYPFGAGLCCASRNLILTSPAEFMGQPPWKLQDHDSYVPSGPAGSVKLGCQLASSSDERMRVGLETDHLAWFKSAYANATAAEVEAACSTGSSIISNPVIFVTRLDPTNPFHHTQTLIHVYMSLMLFSNISAQGMQVVIADKFTQGPFMDLWRRMSAPYPVIHLMDEALPNSTCFKQAIHSHYALPGKALNSYGNADAGPAQCESTIILGMAHWHRYLMGGPASLQELRAWDTRGDTEAHLAASGHRRLKVVFASRMWFEKGMQAGGGLNGWQAQRAVGHEQEKQLALELQKTVMDWNHGACARPVFGWWQKHAREAAAVAQQQQQQQQGCKPTNVTFEFEVAELSLMELYPDQSHTLMRTGVLVAVHGAALQNQIWMRPQRGAVVEIWHNAGGNYHYNNYAKYLGHRHWGVQGLDMTAVARAVSEAMDHVSSKY